MLAFLGIIPGVLSAINFVTGRIFDAKVSMYQARTGANRDVAINAIQAAIAQEREDTARLSIFASNPLLTVLLIAFASPIALWFIKVVAWDIVLSPLFTGHTGTTDPIRGEALEITKTIIYFLFGAPTALGIAKMWFTKGE